MFGSDWGLDVGFEMLAALGGLVFAYFPPPSPSLASQDSNKPLFPSSHTSHLSSPPSHFSALIVVHFIDDCEERSFIPIALSLSLSARATSSSPPSTPSHSLQPSQSPNQPPLQPPNPLSSSKPDLNLFVQTTNQNPTLQIPCRSYPRPHHVPSHQLPSQRFKRITSTQQQQRQHRWQQQSHQQ